MNPVVYETDDAHAKGKANIGIPFCFQPVYDFHGCDHANGACQYAEHKIGKAEPEGKGAACNEQSGNQLHGSGKSNGDQRGDCQQISGAFAVLQQHDHNAKGKQTVNQTVDAEGQTETVNGEFCSIKIVGIYHTANGQSV